MNRVRKVEDKYQVLITPEYKVSPDSSLLIGNFVDEDLRNFYIKEFDTVEDAQCEALKLSDIDWERLVMNHVEIYRRLTSQLKSIISKNNFLVEFKPKLMTAEELKNAFMDRVFFNGGDRFNLRYKLNDIISFTIVNPWSSNLEKISKTIELFREHLYRDDLRIMSKQIVDKKIILLYGRTEFGTIYEIRLVPTLIDQWSAWFQRYNVKNEKNSLRLYNELMQKQTQLDSGPVIV